MQNQNLRCQIYCQKGKNINIEFLPNTKTYSNDNIFIKITEELNDECQLGKIQLKMKNASCRENYNLRTDKPLRVYLPMKEHPEKITAMYLFNEWWTRPAFIEKFQDIPTYTQVAFFKYKNKYSCIVPMVGKNFKTYMIAGTENELCFEMTAWLGGQKSLDEPLYLIAESSSLEKAVHKAFAYLAKYKGIRMREERRIPEMLQYLGWCSWDAFYTDITEEKVYQKATELMDKKVPVRWMLIDDGWLSTKEELLYDFMPDKTKFPKGFQKMTKEIKDKGKIKWFGVWHALGGYWGGILPKSNLSFNEQPYLYKTVNEKLVPSPETGEKFYRDWYQKLFQEGIDFIKVDGQSAVPYYFENTLAISKAARGMNQALEGGASYMDGAIINCMGMAMENILARPTSAISRNSDDFVPNKENGFAEHLLQNAYNSIYHNELYCCDWDMFWTKHEDCVKHSLLRAISGGPVYFSDKIGNTEPNVLKPLTYLDGKLLMMNRSAKPTTDCLFTNPLKSGVLKLSNIANYGENNIGGGIAVYNLTNQSQKYTFSPIDIPDIDFSEKYWIYDYFNQKAKLCNRDEMLMSEMKKDQFAWYQVLTYNELGTFLGLIEKYVGFIAIESVCIIENKIIAIIHEQGPVGFLSTRTPIQVLCNGIDVSQKMSQQELLYTIDLEEKSSKTIVEIIF